MPRDNGSHSTKEIARKAVEEEFRKKRKGRKRRQGDDYLSDSDDEEGGRKPDRKKQTLSLRPTQVKEWKEQVPEEPTYRDRAKERREGKPTDTNGGDSAANDEFPISKGRLDLSLIQKQKAQLSSGAEDIPIGYEGDEDSADESMKIPTLEEAEEFLNNFSVESESTLPHELAMFLDIFAKGRKPIHKLSREVVCGAAGKAIHRSRLVLNASAHPLSRRRAWEVPREVINANAVENTHHSSQMDEVIRSVAYFFPAGKGGNQSLSSPSVKQNCAVDDAVNGVQGAKEDPKDVRVPNTTTVEKSDMDDDDDIFGGLDEYAPPNAS